MSQTPRRLLIFVTLIGLQAALIVPAMAAPHRPTPSKAKARRSGIRWTPPPPPPNLGDPGNRGQGGGSRGSCLAYKDTSAVLPRSQWGRTTLAHPIVWLHLPQDLAANVPLEFVLQDAAGKTLFKQLIDATETTTGMMPIPFPTAAPALEVDQQYRWSIAIYCDAEVPDQPVTVQGWIGRSALSSDTSQRLAAATTAIDKAAIYAAAGIWYDALTTLGLTRFATSNADATIAWDDLLEQADLSAMTNPQAIKRPSCHTAPGHSP
jgi:Domain of Unknown Function (DUF928)